MGNGVPIQVWKVLGGNGAQPEIRRLKEDATETFKEGTPVVVQDSDGMLIESPTLSSALTIAGFSIEPGANLTTEAVPKTLTYGSVPNQANAKLIPGGAPPNDGKCGVLIANDRTLFIGTVRAADTPAQSDIGNIYGMTKNGTSSYWEVDKSITAANSGAIVEIVEIPVISGDPLAPATPVAGGKVVFRITKAGQQFTI